MSIRKEIAERLRQAPSLRAIQHATTIDIAVLSKIANNKRHASGDVIDRLANHFQLELRPIPAARKRLAAK